RQMSWESAFSTKYPIKKTSTISFETIIQPTRAGISGFDKVYLSPKGKQVLTGKLLSVWEEAFTTVASNEISYLPMVSFFDDQSIHSKYGLDVKNFGGSPQDSLERDDIFVLEKGKSLSSMALFEPHFARDLSILLVPAHQLCGGARGNEFQKYYIAEASQKFELDALYSIMVE